MPRDKFDVGDIVEVLRGNDQYCRAVVVSYWFSSQDAMLKVVFLDADDARKIAEVSAYRCNRGWAVSDPKRVRNFTDEEAALAMRILLTGYIPGLDDD